MGYGNTQSLEKRFYVTRGTLGTTESGDPINFVDGTLGAIYFYADPGNAKEHIRPSTKICVELVDQETNKRYTIVSRYDGDGGAPTWFATTVADGLEHIAAGEAVRISVKAGGGNDKVTFAKVETKSGGQWKRRRSDKQWHEVEPIERGQLVHDLITGHNAYVVRNADEEPDEPNVTGSDESDELHSNGQPAPAESGSADHPLWVLLATLKAIGLNPTDHHEIICEAINKALRRETNPVEQLADIHFAEIPRIVHWLKLVKAGEKGLPPTWEGIVVPDKQHVKAPKEGQGVNTHG